MKAAFAKSKRWLLTAALVLALAGALTGTALAVLSAVRSVGGNTFATASCFTHWWWNTGYLYRKPVTVTTGAAAVASGYSVKVTLDHASLVTAGKSLASGNDFRVVRWNTASCSWTELDRVLGTNSAWNTSATSFWFKLTAAISASSSDSEYYLYYGNPSAGAPPATPGNVFVFWDDYPGVSLNAAYTVLRPPTAGWSVGTGTLNINMDPNKDFYQTTNTAPLFHIAAPSGDFEAQVKQIGQPTANGEEGGLLAYQNDDNYIIYAHDNALGGEKIEFGREAAASYAGQLTAVSAASTYLRLTKLGTSYAGYYSTDNGSTFTSYGSGTISLSPVRIGVSAFGFSTNVMTMKFDNLRVRNLVSPEPTTSAGAEALKP